MLPVVARPEVADGLARLSPALLRAIRRLLPSLRAEPMRHSQPLDCDPRIGNLGDCRKVYFDEDEAIRPAGYRIVLRLLPSEDAPERSRSSASARGRTSTSTAARPSGSSGGKSLTTLAAVAARGRPGL